MNFRELLRELDKVGRTTSKDLAHRLGRSVKEISNGLSRLHQMGFAKADKEDRPCRLGKWGDKCNRGYQYTYYVSDQGKSYLKWMNNIKPFEDSERKILMNQIAACLPTELKKAIFTYYLLKAHRHKDPFGRSDFLADLALTVPVLYITPAPLELENGKLAEENRRLAGENQKLASESEKALTEMSGNYDDKIKEMKKEHIAREQKITEELERARTTINTLSHTQRILKRVSAENAELQSYLKNSLLRWLRIFASRKEYLEIWELVNNCERSGLNSINANALSDAMDNSQVNNT